MCAVGLFMAEDMTRFFCRSNRRTLRCSNHMRVGAYTKITATASSPVSV